MPCKRKLIAYSFSHFVVDFLCFFILFSTIAKNSPQEQIFIIFLTYNIIAFGLQFIIGYFYDKFKFPILKISFVFLALALVLIRYNLTSVVLCALGNSFFHIAGGVDSLKNARGKMARSGVFVSFGALGVGLGTIYGKVSQSLFSPFLLLVLAIISNILAKRERDVEFVPFRTKTKLSFEIVILFALTSIAIRGFLGGNFKVSLPSEFWIVAFLPSIASFFGKFIGGFVSDKFGAKWVLASLIVSIPFILLGDINIVLILIGLTLFNMTMPVTLCLLTSKLNRSLGLSFGLTTLALLAGTVICFFVRLDEFYEVLTVCLTILSAALIFIICKEEKINV